MIREASPNLPPERHLASDNNAGVLPEVLTRLAEVNTGHTPGYGHDPYTAHVIQRLVDAFGGKGAAALFFTGTAANVVAAGVCLQRYEAVVCGQQSHLYVDEGGAPERWLGCKLMPLPTDLGRIRPESVEQVLRLRGDEHNVLPKVLTLTQPTELGVCYRPDELAELCRLAHQRGLYVHMDGARLANAAAFLGCTWAELTTDLGVDLVSLGGTKNGLMGAEALVVLRPGLAGNLLRFQKQAMQLASKMRFVAAQFDAWLDGDLWLHTARRANDMAQQLGAWVDAFGPPLERVAPVEANGVFVRMPAHWYAPLNEHIRFYIWEEQPEHQAVVVRWMCSFDTQEADLARLQQAVVQLAQPEAAVQ
jgi:threonine aldolase